MNTKDTKLRWHTGILILAFLISGVSGYSNSFLSDHLNFQDDSLNYVSYQGRIIERNTGEALVFAALTISGTQIGTVTNTDGEFIIKIPRKYIEGKLSITSMGFKTQEIPINSLGEGINTIQLDLNPIPIPEVTIVSRDPEDLLSAALSRIPVNYSEVPVMMTSFYRELIKKNRNFVSVSEAVLETYKAPYNNFFEMDRTRMFKGRKSVDVNRVDTLIMKLQGGPYTSLMLDEVKSRENILPDNFANLYDYVLKGIVNVNDRPTYILSFDQKPEVEVPLYKGNIYIDVDRLAIVGMEFRISDRYKDEVTPYYIVKRPPGSRIRVEDASYIVKFREDAGKWYLNYVRAEIQIWVRWPKKLFRSYYTAISEMAVTDISQENINRFPIRDASLMRDILMDEIGPFADPEYWGDYNVIKPEQSIEEAIEKIGRKLIRDQ